MSAHDDGGLAFPRQVGMSASSANHRNEHVIRSEGGMSLRDYFAAHAPPLPAPIRDAFVRSLRGDGADLQEHAKVCARWSILYADEMLKARKA